MSCFSVVIPTHNRPETLFLAVESVRNQTVMPGELIVVDDGSIPPVTESLFEGFPTSVRCVLYRNDVSLGAARSRNKGVNLSTTDYVCFLDDDDTFKPDKIECVSLVDLSEIDLIYHSAEVHMVNEGVSYTSCKRVVDGSGDLFRKMLVRNRVGGTSMAIVRRTKFLESGGFDPEMPALEDYELWLRLIKNNAIFLFLPKELTNYCCVTRCSSLSKSFDRNESAIQIIEAKYSEDYSQLNARELDEYKDWKLSKLVFQCLLNGDRAGAVKLQARRVLVFPSVSSLLYLVVLFFPMRTIFRLRSVL